MSTTSEYAAPAALTPGGKTFFGQPRGLATLFFTEMWERFSYYGMRALLILFMTAATTGENPGLGLDVGTAAAVYGLYTGLVYLMALPGGWVADNLWGQRKAVYVGGWIIAAGHFSMAVPTTLTFYAGLVLIVLGTGLLKPNVSTVVGDLYPEGGAARDAGFSIFYMGINLGALVGPLLCSFLGESYNWHWGFSAAGFGMVLGLIQYKLGAGLLGDAGHLKTNDTEAEIAAKTRKFFGGFFGIGAVLALSGWLVAQGIIPLTLTQIATALGSSILIVVGIYFAYILTLGGHTGDEKKRLIVILWLFILAAIFWSGFEQAGSSLNLFAQDLTDRNVFGWLMPAGFLQSVNAGFHHHLRPRFRIPLGMAFLSEREPVDPTQVRVRPHRPSGRILRHRLGSGERYCSDPGLSGLVDRDVLPSHDGRTLVVPRRALVHHEAGPRGPSGTDDGHLVRGDRPRDSGRRACRGQLANPRSLCTLPDGRNAPRRRKHRRSTPEPRRE